MEVAGHVSDFFFRLLFVWMHGVQQCTDEDEVSILGEMGWSNSYLRRTGQLFYTNNIIKSYVYTHITLNFLCCFVQHSIAELYYSSSNTIW